MVAPSTAVTGAAAWPSVVAAPDSRTHLPVGSRLVVSRLGGDDVVTPPWATVARVRPGRTAASRRRGGVRRRARECCPKRCWPVCRWSSSPVAASVGVGESGCAAGSARLVRPLTGDVLASAVGEVPLSDPGYREAARRRRAGWPGWLIRYGCAMTSLVGWCRATDRIPRTRRRAVGSVRGASLLVDHVLTRLGGRTAAQAISDGVEPRDVWRALCADFDVPRDQW